MRPGRRGSTWLLSLGALSLAGLLSLSWAGLLRSSGTASRAPARLAEPAPRRGLPRVSTLYQQRASAYQASLFADERRVVLATPNGFTTIGPGQALEERVVELGHVAALQDTSIVFWRSGQLREIALSGEGERELAAVARPPRYLLAAEGRIAWVQTELASGSSLWTLSGGEVRVVHESEGRVCAAVMRGADVYWVVQGRGGSWTVERLGLDEQRRAFTAPHHGRPPSMLAVSQEGVYFYDGPERGVVQLSFDLTREDAVLPNVICSPIAVSSRVVCAQVGGLFDIARPGTPPRFLASEPAGPIVATAATGQRVFWVAENGEGHLVVRTVPLSAP